MSKNALIRALNNIYEQAKRIGDGGHQDFKPFMAYCRIVGDMLRLQYEGKHALCGNEVEIGGLKTP